MAENVLYYGDNLGILRDHIASESVDLIYLDPPFKSDPPSAKRPWRVGDQSYNVGPDEERLEGPGYPVLKGDW